MASLPRLPLWLKRNQRQFERLCQGRMAIYSTADTPADLKRANIPVILSKSASPLHGGTCSTITTTETATVNIDGVHSTDDKSIVIKTSLEANSTETVSSTTANR